MPFSKYSFLAYVKEYMEKVNSETKPQQMLESTNNDKDDEPQMPTLKRPKRCFEN